MYQDMKPLILALLLLLLPQTTAPAQTATSLKDVLGWQEARWGMTTEELQKQFGGKLSKRVKKDYAVKGEKRYAYADYEIKGLDLADDVFDVDFLMDIDTHQLIGIRVQTAEDKQYDSQARVIFEKVEKSLQQKYGTPGHAENEPGRTISTRTRRWVFPTTTIELRLLTGFYNLVLVTYEPTLSKDAVKL
jgi:hypothetical protein